MSDRVIVALDFPGTAPALALVDRLGPACTFYKVGLELYTAQGAAAVHALRRRNKRVFLDLKLHDIPTTVARATARAGDLGARFLTVHASGGPAMLEAAAGAAPGGLTLLAVTVLTSLDAGGLGAVFGRRVEDAGLEAERLARLARGAGVGGVVCAASEAARLRAAMGPGAAVVTPGIRAPGEPRHDQARTRSASQAFRAGAVPRRRGPPGDRRPRPGRRLRPHRGRGSPPPAPPAR